VFAALDGDVVSRCEVRATLRSTDAVLEPAAPVAWQQASGTGPAASLGWSQIAGLETERALSHLSWLHRFLRLLGWSSTAETVRRVVKAVLHARTAMSEARPVVNLPNLARDCAALAATLESSGAFRRRTAGLGRLTEQDARLRGLVGPNAWASGASIDLRAREPFYTDLGFEPVGREEGDARARALVRVDDARQSIELLGRAIERLSEPSPIGHPEVEGPRGPVNAPRANDEAARAAADLAVGREWGAALVVIASFDLSPWSVER
jgi:Ni,Fe-hydrogenase III large subunit